MHKLFLFFAGAFLANSIPHFVNGISGRDFGPPFLHRIVPAVPNPLFNTIWGMLFFVLSYVFAAMYGRFEPVFPEGFTINLNAIVFSSGFAAVSVYLSLFFAKGGWKG